MKKKTLLLTHAGTDVDAIAAAAALCFSIPKNKFTIGCIDHLNLNAKAFSKKMKISYAINPELKEFQAIVLIDFNSFEMAGTMNRELKEFSGKIYSIDHHSKEKQPVALPKNALADEKAVSTTEIIYSLLKKSRIKISTNSFACIAAGILTDSNFFATAEKNTFEIFSDSLKKSKKSFQDISLLFNVETNFSEKIASLKAAKRCKIFRIEKFIIATSMVDAFEASAADALVKIGADAAFVAAFDSKTEKVNISARASIDFLKHSKLNLAKVFFELEEKFNGKGGGHPGAAAFNGEGIPEIALEECVKILFKFLSEKNPEAQLKEYN